MASEVIISRSFSHEETRDIAQRLEQHDAIFSQLWQIGHQTFNSEIKTACVAFDEIGQVISLEVNPNFWKLQSPKQQAFIMCHELLHVLLEHGRRAKDSPTANAQANNVCMDVVVNELLVGSFGFDRKEIDPKNNLCWIDTVFKDRDDILSDQTFEYYLNQLPKVKCKCSGGKDGKNGKGCSCPLPGKVGGQVLDDHSKLKPADISKMLEQAASRMSQEERENVLEKLGKEGEATDTTSNQRGTTGGNFVKIMSAARAAKKRKWESVIKKCLRKIAAEGPEETWITARNRRLAGINSSK
ncbi:MAG TPA: hypothetical protein VNX68_19020, partial [Nitrosopumilaceae archaeon]|nr:hypothetical protein [Nitrosopumilaceae archaeon]